MKKLLLCAAAAMTVSTVTTVSVQAQPQTGRQLDIIADATGTQNVPALGGVVDVFPVVGIFWDERCAQVEYTFNTNRGANGGAITPAQLAQAVQDGLDRWNANPSSYIEMNVTAQEDLGFRTRTGGDFINEITFITAPGFGALASSPSTVLAADTTFVAGDDLNGDGDSDVYDPVAEGQNVCTDIDGDGNIEFPAGDYKAGTILDNDVQFSSTVAWELVATNSNFADVDGVSTHEFGHSHGLNHGLINQTSATDGTGATMFPFIDTTDAASELGARSLHPDDLAASAHVYPEGVGTAPITQLQPGDVAFDVAYDVITGEVEFDSFFLGGFPGPVPTAGAAITMSTLEDGAVSQSYSGRTLVFVDGGQIAFPESFSSGEYNVAVPKGGIYRATMEALDGDPAAANNISINAIIADIFGLTTYPEEGWTRRGQESGMELNPGNTQPIPSFFDGTDLTVNNEFVLRNHSGNLSFIGTGAISAANLANEVVYAERFNRDDVLTFLDAGLVPVSGTFRTGTLDASAVPRFIEARLVLGRLRDDGSVNITRTLRRANDFIGQDADSAPFYFNGANGLANQMRNLLNNNANLDVYLVLEANDMLGRTGASGFPPNFVGLDATIDAGTSFRSINRAPLVRSPAGTTQLIELNWVGIPELGEAAQ